jgi:hypothetical protein
MSEIPRHLQRRFEQRWAARFVSPVASAAPRSIGSKGTVKGLPRPAKTKEKPTGLSQRGLVYALAVRVTRSAIAESIGGGRLSKRFADLVGVN